MNRATTLAIGAVLLASCTGLQAPQVESPALYLLDAQAVDTPARPQRDLVVAVSMPRARPGYDTAQMAYVRQPHELEYFTKSRWADTPSRMLAPLLSRALEQGGAFRSVVQAPSAVPGDLRLDTEWIRLQHDFATRPSRVELALRAQLVDLRSRRVVGTAEFEEVESAPSDDAYGGVIAANRGLQRLLTRLTEFCAQQSGIR
jgi:cholesterol transport system auxiliary component